MGPLFLRRGGGSLSACLWCGFPASTCLWLPCAAGWSLLPRRLRWAGMVVASGREQVASRTQALQVKGSLQEEKPFIEAARSYRNCSSFRQMSAGNGNQLQRPWGDITGLLGNDMLAVPRMKCCDCCLQAIRKIYLPARCITDLKVSSAEQPMGGVGLLWAKCELCMKIVLFLIPGAERNHHRLVQPRVLLPSTVSN